MSRVEITLKRLGVCSCGDNTLHDEIQLGKTYRVLASCGHVVKIHGYEYHCGACKRKWGVDCVLAEESGGSLGPIPAILFESPEER